MMASDAATVLAQLSGALKAAVGATFSDEQRNQLVFELRDTLQQVESPWQRMQAMVWEDTGHAAAIKIAHDVNLFKNWADAGGEESSVDELFKLPSPQVELALFTRVLNALVYRGTLISPSPRRYALSTFARSLAEPTMAACLDYWFNFQIPALTAYPSFVQSTSYKLPTDATNTAWNHATKDPTPFFGWLQQRPEMMAKFGMVMQRYSGSQPAWVTLYPSEKLLEDASSDRPLVVDIGGSLGHDIMKFVQKHDPAPGSCFLLDNPEVLEKAEVSEAVIKKAHNFFEEPQPIKGARAYYLHSVLHDWPDDKCREILVKIKDAMDTKESRILIHELIQKDDGSRDLVALGEFTVLAILGSPERTRIQWTNLIESAGLRLVNVHSNPLSTHSLLEVMI